MSIENYRRFTGIGFDDFREMAKNDSLSRYEKITCLSNAAMPTSIN